MRTLYGVVGDGLYIFDTVDSSNTKLASFTVPVFEDPEVDVPLGDPDQGHESHGVKTKGGRIRST